MFRYVCIIILTLWSTAWIGWMPRAALASSQPASTIESPDSPKPDSPGSPPLVVIVGSPTVGFFDEGLDFSDHEEAGPAELARHKLHPMATTAITAEDRPKLQSMLPEQETTEATAAFQRYFGKNLQVVIQNAADVGSMAREIIGTKSASWKDLTTAGTVQKLISMGVSQVILLRVTEVSHGTGTFVRPKAFAHYFCVDADVEGRVILPDGTLLPSLRSRICKNEMFHSHHTESLNETTARQSGALYGAFDELARAFSRQQRH